MKLYVYLAVKCRHCSLLRTAKVYLYGFVPSIFIIVLVLALCGCSLLELKHRPGRLPKIEVITDIADDVEIKLKDDGIIVELEWEIDL